MKKFDETQAYLENKKRIFSTLINAIADAIQHDKSKIYVKQIKILEEEVDVIAEKKEWSKCLEKAILFFESIEDYESCQVCSNLQEQMRSKSKIKKSRKNGGKG